MRRARFALALLSCLLPSIAGAQAPAPAPPPPPVAAAELPPVDYASGDAWLCRPGRTGDACDLDLTTTVVAADGSRTVEKWAANPRAPIDCFYVYPTVSRDPGGNSDMTPGDEERNVVRQQFARFGSECRLFAPMYRQITLAALRSFIGGDITALGRGAAYGDVLAAWRHYLQRDNGGRGVVLIGHSQGAMVLTRLIADEIDGKPIQQRLVSAILLGTNVPVPVGQAAGGAFKQVGLCRAPGETGCLVSYASFRVTVPPPPASLFGRVAGAGMQSACTNPAALGGGGAALKSYFLSDAPLIAASRAVAHAWVSTGPPIDTPFVSVPGLVSAQCATTGGASFLELTVHGDPADPRADDIPGDLLTLGKPSPGWGMHLVDVNVAMGNLVDLVRAQSKAYAARPKR